MAKATRGLADVRVIRPASAASLIFAPHSGELMFAFVLEGRATLEKAGDHPLSACDAFTIPAGEAWALSKCSTDLELLQVVLPAE